jgi:hypothetical protein
MEPLALARAIFLYWENLVYVLLLMVYTFKKYMQKPKEKFNNHSQSVMYLGLTNINQLEDGQRLTLACLSKLVPLAKK